MNNFLHNNQVAVFCEPDCAYSQNAPFHPNKLYPEYPFGPDDIEAKNTSVTDSYTAVRRTLILLGLDSANQESVQWNPLGFMIKPGQTVVIKPNFVLHRNDGGHDPYANITHPSVIRAVVDYCYIALQGRGCVCIADAPQMDCEFDKLIALTGLKDLVDFYRNRDGFSLSVLDLRRLKCKYDPEKGIFPADSFMVDDNSDPLGSTIIDLGASSRLHNLAGLENLYGADYDRRFTAAHHNRINHCYAVSNTVLRADALICIPKLKTHKKVGVTLNMKLLVGINTDKNYLAHYRVGSPSRTGDEFPDSKQASVSVSRKYNRFLADHLLKKRTRWADALVLAVRTGLKPMTHALKFAGFFKKKDLSDHICQGNWHGNDTAWRMALDLTRIFVYADAAGKIMPEPQRRIFSIVDGILAGEGEGPLAARPFQAGALVAGENILAVDSVAAAVMGFDYRKIKMLANAWQDRDPALAAFQPDEITIISNHAPVQGLSTCRFYHMAPHSGWKGHIELDYPD